MLRKFLLLATVACGLSASAQKTHTVAKGDNPYNIAKKYSLSLDDLLAMNPSVKNGKLVLGQVLIIGKGAPTAKPATKTAAAVSPETGKIILQPKQTIYGITRQYHITETDLRRLNPDLDNNLKIGSEITLPQDLIKKYSNGQPVATSEPVAVSVSSVASSTGTYEVQPKDNYYRITKKFSLTQQDLYALNPGLEEKGLKPGMVIRVVHTDNASAALPNTPSVQPSKEKSEKLTAAGEYVTYTVKDGDTVYGIINRFGTTLEALLALNPELANGLKAGMILKIKKLDEAYVKKSGDALEVVLMLPFGFDSNDSKFRTMAADFLSGAQLAAERSARNGQKLNVKIIDAGNEVSFKNSLTQISQDNTDLIIGPFLKSNILEVLNYVESSRIPVVAPFANSEDLYSHSNLIIAEPSDDIYADRIAKEVAAVYSDQRIYIDAGDDRSGASLLKSRIEKAVKNPTIIIVNSAADIQVDKNMATGQPAPIIAILASSDDAEGNAFTSRLTALTSETSGIRAFSTSYHPSFEKKEDELRAANLVYLMDRKINTEGTFEKQILAEYRKKYCKTPSKYAIIGFDVVNDALSRENARGEIFRQMGKVQTQLATKYEYERSKNGAYVNKGYRVVRLVP